MQGFPVEYQLEQKRILSIAWEDKYKLFWLGLFFSVLTTCTWLEYFRGVGELHGVLLCFTNEVDNFFYWFNGTFIPCVNYCFLNTDKYI